MIAKTSMLASVALVALLGAVNPAAAQNTNDILLRLDKPTTDVTAQPIRVIPRKTVFVVRYTTSGEFVLVRDYKDDLSNGFDASDLANRRLKPLGFTTRIEKTKNTGFDTIFSISTRIRTKLFVRTSGPIERTFDSKEKAVEFRRSLISLVKDRRLTVEDVRTK